MSIEMNESFLIDSILKNQSLSDDFFVMKDNNSFIVQNSSDNEFVYCGKGLETFYHTYRQFHGYVSLMVCLFGMLANSLNIIVLTRRDMISPTNAILTGLAFADNLVMIEYIPFAFHLYILGDRPMEEKFSYGWTVFVLIHAHVTQVFHTISIWLTVTLAVWRYLVVAHSLYNRHWCTLDRALLAIVIAYVCSPILCIPLYLIFSIQETSVKVGNHSQIIYFLGTSELAKANDNLLENINFWIYSVVIKIIPCFALTILSFQLIRALMEAKRRRQQLKKRPVSYPNPTTGSASATPLTVPSTGAVAAAASKSQSGGGGSGGGGGVADRSREPDGERHTDRTTRMLLAVLFLFLMTEFPQGILALLSGVLGNSFFNNCYRRLGEVMDILALINGAINFILYCAMSRQFRQTFRRIFNLKSLNEWIPIPRQNQRFNHPITNTTIVNETLPMISNHQQHKEK